MEFDITNLNKILLLKALFSHAEPLRRGKDEYDTKKLAGENVDGLTERECYDILAEFSNPNPGIYHILDYYKGKPMKLYFYRKNNYRIIVNSEGYDERNGKYRFLEAMLSVFQFDEILILKKGYRKHIEFTDVAVQNLSYEEEQLIKTLIRNTIVKENDYGKHFVINHEKVSYTPPFLRVKW